MEPRVRHKIKRQFANLVDLPPEAVMNTVKINMIGNMEVTIENHTGLLQYTTECVKVSSTQGTISITGRNLYIQLLSGDEIKIAGLLVDVHLA